MDTAAPIGVEHQHPQAQIRQSRVPVKGRLEVPRSHLRLLLVRVDVPADPLAGVNPAGAVQAPHVLNTPGGEVAAEFLEREGHDPPVLSGWQRPDLALLAAVQGPVAAPHVGAVYEMDR